MTDMPVSHTTDARGVATVLIDRADKLNAMSGAVARGLAAAAEALGRAPRLRAVVLRGAGTRAFVGGADINELAALDRDTAEAFITSVHRACDGFRRLPVPVIARIQGHALGAGLELAAACDLRVASTNSSFGMPEVRIGVPSVVEAALLPHLIGWGRTRLLLLTGEPIDARTAAEWGLIDSLAAPEELDAAVERLLEPILASGREALRLQKALMQSWEELPTSAAVQAGIASFRASFETDEPRRMIGEAVARLRSRRR
ncbi:MAG: enoyl-CoA hydratase/isomerase family protein [Proteobacteria bacterium]|nr:enoyl-CoA hydratase/isomerase family protein [Pseudomonadota bacterium]